MAQYHTCAPNYEPVNGFKEPVKIPNCYDDISINDPISAMYPMINEAETPLPRQWSSKKLEKCPSLWLSQNDLRVHYKGIGKNSKDAASVRTTSIIPPACGIYYYEVKIISKGRDGYMGVGVTSLQKMDHRLPGWDKNSYGYHGDDGNMFCSSGTGQPYGPTFTTGDIIGCAVNYIDNSCFYTKNGVNLGVAFRDLPPNLYPTVGLQTPGEILEANFGLLSFCFDIEDYKRSWQDKIYSSIKSFNINTTWSEWQISMQKLVTSYLANQGYSSTAEIFSKSSNCEIDEDLTSVKNRQRIIELVMAGRISEAIEKTNHLYPGFFERRRDLHFKLKCRQFVEMINGVDVSVVETGGDAKFNGQIVAMDNKKELNNMMSPVLSNAPSNGTSNGHETDMDTTDSSASGEEDAIVMTTTNGNCLKTVVYNDACTDKTRTCLTDASAIEKILNFGRELHSLNLQLKKDLGKEAVESKLLEEVFSLLAYTDPWTSPVGWQLKPQARESICQKLNMALLDFLGLPNQSALELTLAHTVQCLRTMSRAQLSSIAFAKNQLPFIVCKV